MLINRHCGHSKCLTFALSLLIAIVLALPADSTCLRHLQRWTQDLHAAASWGDVHELETVLLCKRPEYLRVRDIPVTERVRIRNRSVRRLL